MRAILVIGILSTLTLASPALAWNGVQGGTGHQDPGCCSNDVSAGGGSITTRDGRVVDNPGSFTSGHGFGGGGVGGVGPDGNAPGEGPGGSGSGH